MKTPSSPLSPGGSDRSSASGLSEHAAKAALKYKTASPASPLTEKREFEGPGFNPVRISGNLKYSAQLDTDKSPLILRIVKVSYMSAFRAWIMIHCVAHELLAM